MNVSKRPCLEMRRPPDAFSSATSLFRAFAIRSLLLGGRELDPGAGCEPLRE